jgi:hypothetical protein
MRPLPIVWTALAACDLGSPSIDGDVEETLTETGGCADLYTYAVDAADEVILEVWFDGPIAAAAGVDTSEVFSLPDAMVDVTLEIGTRVSDIACDDVAENGGPQVDETWTAVSGEVALDIVHQSGADPKADVVLTNVVLESPEGEQITIETFSWDDVTVGWFAG